MGRGSTQVLIRKIMESLVVSPKSSTEIAEETGLDRTAITRYLEVLKESSFVVEEQQGTSKKYILSSNYRMDTFFGLSLDTEANELTNSIYHLIEKKWEQKTGRKLLKTTAQKIMYQVIEKCELKIPHGWYIYGGICVKPYDNTYTYIYKEVSERISTCVNDTVAEYSVNTFEYESKQLQYRKAGKKLYDVKEDILKLLYSKNFSKNSMYVFQKFYSKFWQLAPKGDDSYANLLNEYDTLLIDITKEWDNFVQEQNERNFAEFKQKIISSFEAIWKLVAMYNLKQDLYEGDYYLEKELAEHFKFDINQAKDDIIEICSELQDMIPFEESDDSLFQEFTKLIQTGGKLSSEEQKKRIEQIQAEVEKRSKSQ